MLHLQETWPPSQVLFRWIQSRSKRSQWNLLRILIRQNPIRDPIPQNPSCSIQPPFECHTCSYTGPLIPQQDLPHLGDSLSRAWKQPIVHKSHNFPSSLGQTTYFIPKATYFEPKTTILRLLRAKYFRPHISHKKPRFSQLPRAKDRKNILQSKPMTSPDSAGQRIQLRQTTYFQLKAMPCPIPQGRGYY